jgi:ABC-type lipoprotein export system ATPase subunit
MNKTVTLTIRSGTDKRGRKERWRTLVFKTGEVIAMVGVTGSGKTRLLADIERLSSGDSPTGRVITLTGCTKQHIASGHAVSRISQTMQFFLDLTVHEFIAMHMRSRGLSGSSLVRQVVSDANVLAGEPFHRDQPLSALSGGQARALMVADAVLISDSPVLLIDEIENAGIDRQAALEFLLEKKRLIFIATHDPLIALRADRRLIFAEGGIIRITERAASEEQITNELARFDKEITRIRKQVRAGVAITRTPDCRRT